MNFKAIRTTAAEGGVERELRPVGGGRPTDKEK